MTRRNLTVDTVVPYLVARNFVTTAAIVDGDLEVVDAGRRNQNLRVVRRDGPGYLLKQPGEGEFATDATVRWEAAFYNSCQHDPGAGDVRPLLPALHGWDDDHGVLALELVPGRPLWSHYAATAAPDFPTDAAAPLGDALGRVHRTFRDRSSPERAWIAGLSDAPPWILFAHKPPAEIYARLSPANLQVLRHLQKNAPISAGLDALREEWTAETLVHNDLKGDNILVSIVDGQPPRIHIVDWELIQIGDPAWDVGAMFRDVLDYWLMSLPLSGDLTAEQMLQGASVPLAKLHPAARAFWQAYRASAGIESDDAAAFLLRALRYGAARMAQGAYELSAGHLRPANIAVALLQLASNIMADPREASLHLFGIPVPWRQPGRASAHE